MPPFSEFEEKMDVLDIIIKILKDHEGHLSKLVGKFDDACKTLEHLSKTDEAAHPSTTNLHSRINVIKCEDWPTFSNLSKDASSVTFESEDGIFSVSSVVHSKIFVYSERLPEVKLRFEDELRKVSGGKLSFCATEDLFTFLETWLKSKSEIVENTNQDQQN